MEWLNQKRGTSRLGQILLGRKLISQEQLDQAIREQQRTGQRLGEVLAAMQLITEAQVGRAMRRQRNLRLAAALAASLLAPLQAYAAAAVPAAAVRTAERGARVLSDDEMREVSGQGRDDERLREALLRAQLQLAAAVGAGPGGAALEQMAGEPLPLAGELAKLFHPLAGLLGAETSISGVTYDPAQSSAVVNKDGSVTLRLPSTIGEITFRNIRVGQSGSGPSFGSIALHDIDLRGTTITIAPHVTR